MKTLKHETHEMHKKAEAKKFASALVSGNIPPQTYYQYLCNQHKIYHALECCVRNSIPRDLRKVFRTKRIIQDLECLENFYGFKSSTDLITQSTWEYVNYVYQRYNDDEVSKLLLHMYVRHLGDMYGGKIIQTAIKKRTGDQYLGEGKMYDFEDKNELKSMIRDIVSVEDADEASLCFGFAIRLFEELEDGLE